MAHDPGTRIHDLTPETTSPEQAEVLDRLVGNRGRLLMPYRVWIHSAGLAAGMEKLGTHLNKASTLAKPERELVVLSAAVHGRSTYVTVNHARHARESGLPEDLVTAILEGRHIPLADPRLSALDDLVADLISGATPDDAGFGRYVETLGRAGLAEAIALFGYYTAVSMAMRIHDVPAREG